MKNLTTAVGLGLAASLMSVTGVAHADNVGTTEGCTPGYWKNHTDSWWETPTEQIAPGTTLAQAQFTPKHHPASDTLLAALNYKGGPGLAGAEGILLRAASAAWLNAAHEDLDYPYRRWGAGGILQLVNDAIASDNRATMINLAAQLDKANNLGCPLD